MLAPGRHVRGKKRGKVGVARKELVFVRKSFKSNMLKRNKLKKSSPLVLVFESV